MTAMTTVWLSCSPDKIWMRVGSDAPVVTTTVCGLPLTRIWTVLPVAVVCTALVGTVRTWTTWLVTMVAVAETPGLIELLLSASCAVTTNVATPEVMVAAGEIAVTLPCSAWVEPAGVTWTVWPTATRQASSWRWTAAGAPTAAERRAGRCSDAPWPWQRRVRGWLRRERPDQQRGCDLAAWSPHPH